jgi:hypothetical protein
MTPGTISTATDGWRWWTPGTPNTPTAALQAQKWTDPDPPELLDGCSWAQPEELWTRFVFIDRDDATVYHDFKQGALGDCWFLGVVTTLFTCEPNMAHRLFHTDETHGMYTFRFCVDRPITVDRRIPVIERSTLRPMACGPNEATASGAVEIWPILLEKAVAKLMGGYGALHGGLATTAFTLLTGRPAHSILETNQRKPKTLRDPKALWRLLVKQKFEGTFMTLSFREGREDKGIVPHHVYGILSVCLVTLEDTKTKARLLRLHNPWNNGVEWNGPWCNTDVVSWAQRTATAETAADRLGHRASRDGTFFMCIHDVACHISRLDLAPPVRDT